MSLMCILDIREYLCDIKEVQKYYLVQIASFISRLFPSFSNITRCLFMKWSDFKKTTLFTNNFK